MSILKHTIVEVDEIKFEEGAEESLSSPEMRPYIDLMKALIGKEDTSSHLEEIRQIPLEKRYVWRIASAVKWGFADFDDVSVAVDRQTLSPENLAKVKELVKHRPIQFCLFVKELVGVEEMERLINQGIAIAKEEKQTS
jgi:hypothetical protein